MLYSVLFLLVPVANAAFSVHYAGNNNAVLVADNHFRNNLKAEHVADLFARVSGKAPLLHEGRIVASCEPWHFLNWSTSADSFVFLFVPGTLDLPSADILSTHQAEPVILELFGGSKFIISASISILCMYPYQCYAWLADWLTSAPATDVEDVTVATEIARSDAARGPALSNIHSILQKHNIKATSKTVDMAGPDSLRVAKEWMSAQTQPVVILHHDYVAAPRVTRRTASEYTNSTGLTEEEINDYQVIDAVKIQLEIYSNFLFLFVQIFLWVSVGFFLLLLASVCMITNMDVIPDSILFAKFQSSRANKLD